MSSSDQLLNDAMLMLAAQPDAVFVGQGVAYGGVATYRHLEGVPAAQRVEFPVAENLQLGYCTGLALTGFLPICIFPRIDFMLLALDQLVNHLDKLSAMSRGEFAPKVIIRTRVGSKAPLDAGPQHTQDHADAFDDMTDTVSVLKITDERMILPVYARAVAASHSVVVVEALG